MTSFATSPEIISFSAAELNANVRAFHPAIAVFDCDGTLWAGDAGSEFMIWSMMSGLLSPKAREWMDTRYLGYRSGEVSELAICGEMVQVYRGLRESELRLAARTFVASSIQPRIFAEIRQLCEELAAAGTTIWAVSSTNNWVIEEAVQHFGIPAERVLAARVRVNEGTITDDLLDVPTDKGKVESLARAGITRPDAVFGNSIHDAAMLAIAQHPFVVNPTPELLQIAAAERWPVFQPPITPDDPAAL